MPPASTLLFGVEIELLIRPKPALYGLINQYGYQESQEYYQLRKNREAVYQALAQALSQGGLETEMDEDKSEFLTWMIAYDGSIRESSPHDGFCESIYFLRAEGPINLFSRFTNFAHIALLDGVEIISKVLTSIEEWQSELDLAWDILNENCYIRADPSCGTHVHVSPGGRYTLDGLKCVAKAAVYYEPAITSIMPNDRKDCAWSRSNIFESEQLGNAYDAARTSGYGCLFDWIDSFRDEETLSSIISPCKHVSWNFKNAVPGGCGTVEFRRPPQVTSAGATKHWIAFTLCFIKYSLHCDFSKMSQLTAEPSSADLQEAISWAASQLGSASTAIRPLNDAVATTQQNQLSPQDAARIRELKDQNESVFARRVGNLSQ